MTADLTLPSPSGTSAPSGATAPSESPAPSAESPATVPAQPEPAGAAPWWRSAVTYQLYIRSFADGDGDGLGDVAGMASRLPYLKSLGVDAIWINPWYPSPQADAGYDVADYQDVEPAFGTLAEGTALIAAAHEHGIRVLLDIVPNHTSDEHAWFVRAVAAGKGSPEREYYHFRDGLGPHGDTPPNNWKAIFGGRAWTRITEPDGSPGQWYLHLFDPKQPDLNWDNPLVRADMLDVLRFWFDRGVDGFRIDVAHGLIKNPALPDLADDEEHILQAASEPDHPHWDRPGVHEIYREWRALADSYTPPRVFVAEAWVSSPQRLAAYLRPDELHTAFDFDFVTAPWRASDLRATAESSLAAHRAVGAPVMWVLSNHDIPRHVTRLGRAQPASGGSTLTREVVPVDLELGRRRARAALLLELALPGGVYLYQGEELGLEEVEDLPEALLQDPTWERSGHTERGRDGCRVPLPWTATGPSLGFGAGPGWLPQPAAWAQLAADVQEQDRGSMLWFYRDALRLRRELPELGAGPGSGSSTGSGSGSGTGAAAEVEWLDRGADVLAFRRGDLICIVNTGTAATPLPAGQPLIVSGSIVDGFLPPDTAAWVRA